MSTGIPRSGSWFPNTTWRRASSVTVRPKAKWTSPATRRRAGRWATSGRPSASLSITEAAGRWRERDHGRVDDPDAADPADDGGAIGADRDECLSDPRARRELRRDGQGGRTTKGNRTGGRRSDRF